MARFGAFAVTISEPDEYLSDGLVFCVPWVHVRNQAAEPGQDPCALPVDLCGGRDIVFSLLTANSLGAVGGTAVVDQLVFERAPKGSPIHADWDAALFGAGRRNRPR